MMNTIFAALILTAVVSALFTGQMQAVSAAVLSSAADAVDLALSLLGGMALWCGFMKIAAGAGLTRLFARLCRPLLRCIFRDLPPDSEAEEAVSMNMAANLLGLGNAATPLGLRAMKALKRLSPQKETASADMIRFVVLNTASIQLLPTTVAILRQNHGAADPFDILPATLLCSFSCAAFAVACACALTHREKEAR